MANTIVTVITTQTSAPAPNTTQKTGVIISQGGTTQANNSLTLVGQVSDVTPILAAAKTLTTLVWASSVVTGTTAAPHGYRTGSTVSLTISGAAPAAYNGTFPCFVTGPESVEYGMAADPGAATAFGSMGYLVSMTAGYFASTLVYRTATRTFEVSP